MGIFTTINFVVIWQGFFLGSKRQLRRILSLWLLRCLHSAQLLKEPVSWETWGCRLTVNIEYERKINSSFTYNITTLSHRLLKSSSSAMKFTHDSHEDLREKKSPPPNNDPHAHPLSHIGRTYTPGHFWKKWNVWYWVPLAAQWLDFSHKSVSLLHRIHIGPQVHHELQ